jgi:hypothetical protein
VTAAFAGACFAGVVFATGVGPATAFARGFAGAAAAGARTGLGADRPAGRTPASVPAAFPPRPSTAVVAFACVLPFAGAVAAGAACDVGRARAGVRDGVGFEAGTRAPDTFGDDPARSSRGPE